MYPQLCFLQQSANAVQRAGLTPGKGLESAKAAEDKSNFKRQALKYMISGQGKSLTQIDEELANIQGSDDEDLAEIRRNFQNNMKLFGTADQETETARNYESLPNYLLATIRDLNQQLADLRNTEKQLRADKERDVAAAKTRADAAETARDAARKRTGNRARQVQPGPGRRTQDHGDARKSEAGKRGADHRA